MSRDYEKHRAKRNKRIRARDRRFQRESGGRRIESPEKMQGSCAGCLAEIPARLPVFRRERPQGEAELYCSTDCLVAGAHWVDPSLCGGCGGTHRLGVRP